VKGKSERKKRKKRASICPAVPVFPSCKEKGEKKKGVYVHTSGRGEEKKKKEGTFYLMERTEKKKGGRSLKSISVRRASGHLGRKKREERSNEG